MDLRSSQALEPYVLLSKSASSPNAALELIRKATSDRNVFSFARLIHTPALQRLSTGSPENAASFQILLIFAYGTLRDYHSRADSLPKLTPIQERKLRLLSLITLSAQSLVLPYDQLRGALDLPSDQAVEDIVVESVYSDLLQARLNPALRVVEVSSVAPIRDVPEANHRTITKRLGEWQGNTERALASNQQTIRSMRDQSLHDHALNRYISDLIEAHSIDRPDDPMDLVPHGD